MDKDHDPISLSNRRVFERPEIIGAYTELLSLFEGERSALGVLGESLRDMEVLDLGVGMGRTTHEIAGQVRRYTAADVSAEMIKAFNVVHGSNPDVHASECCDACNLPFDEKSFDLIVFSYNGIDYVGHDSRMKILEEIHRVLRPGGWFLFSTHMLPRVFYKRKLFGNRDEWKKYRSRTRWRYWWYNRHARQGKKQGWAIVRDSSHRFALLTYYVMPGEALRQLDHAGYNNIRTFRGKSGDEMDLGSFISVNEEWVVVLARRA